MRKVLLLLSVALGAACGAADHGPLAGQPAAGDDWPAYGSDVYGTRHSSLTQIDRDNVAQLTVAWTYHTGETTPRFDTRSETSFETTPLVVDGLMYVSTPLGRVIALDPATGAEQWTFDPAIDRRVTYGDFTNRGVATWLDPAAGADTRCRRRIFVATIDGRLIALDAPSGAPCAGFGDNGTVSLRARLRVPPFEDAAHEVTSPPVVVAGLVITGSAVSDNSNLAPASGEVQAFDARTGEPRWVFDPIPQDPDDPEAGAWQDGSATRTGGANVWSVMAADPERGLVFAPTSSPAPDYYGGLRPGRNDYANSVVAIDAATGRVVWHYQTVHHDLWDYDNASPPALATVRRDGAELPAVIQATKTGQLFVLHRETGEPLFAVEERAVPSSTIPGEAAWPTQPFTTVTPPLSPHTLRIDEAWGATDEERETCRQRIAGLRNDGVFTPPSFEGTLVLPSNIGGAHWGGVAVDPGRHIVVVPVNRLAAMVQLIPIEAMTEEEADREEARTGLEYTHMVGSPYIMRRGLLMSPGGLPCTPPPWGALVAISLETGARLWEVPLGTMPGGEANATPGPGNLGSPNLGGAITTASGLVFIGATLDRAIRAYDVESGRELWRAALPAGGKATPMTYAAGGRQFVVIAAGGGGPFGEGDAVVAFALPSTTGTGGATIPVRN